MRFIINIQKYFFLCVLVVISSIVIGIEARKLITGGYDAEEGRYGYFATIDGEVCENSFSQDCTAADSLLEKAWSNDSILVETRTNGDRCLANCDRDFRLGCCACCGGGSIRVTPLCGGVLIAPNVVLSSCYVETNQNVTLGRRLRENEGTIFTDNRDFYFGSLESFRILDIRTIVNGSDEYEAYMNRSDEYEAYMNGGDEFEAYMNRSDIEYEGETIAHPSEYTYSGKLYVVLLDGVSQFTPIPIDNGICNEKINAGTQLTSLGFGSTAIIGDPNPDLDEFNPELFEQFANAEGSGFVNYLSESNFLPYSLQEVDLELLADDDCRQRFSTDIVEEFEFNLRLQYLKSNPSEGFEYLESKGIDESSTNEEIREAIRNSITISAPRWRDDVFCTIGDGNKDVCFLDEGGPILLKGVNATRDVLFGLIGSSFPACSMGLPSTHYRISDNFHLIEYALESLGVNISTLSPIPESYTCTPFKPKNKPPSNTDIIVDVNETVDVNGNVIWVGPVVLVIVAAVGTAVWLDGRKQLDAKQSLPVTKREDKARFETKQITKTESLENTTTVNT